MYQNANEKNFEGKRDGFLNAKIQQYDRHRYEDVKRQDDVYRVQLPYGFVSDALCDEIREWRGGESIFIAADTGLGKNTFVENCLIPYAREIRGKILFLTNRVALGRQEKRRLAKIFGMEDVLEDYTDKGLDNLREFGCLTVVSYQQLEEGLRYGNPYVKQLEKTDFNFVVMDEAHYFMTDSGFNSLTDISFGFLCGSFCQAVKVYMTATPQEIFPLLKERDLKKYMDESGEDVYITRRWKLYEFGHDYSWIEAKAFDTVDDLIDIVSRSSEKWLIFVNSKKMGRELEEMLGEGVFITAESKDKGNETNPHFSQVVNEERCCERVTITTAVLENGVNIKDFNVKNVAIFSHDQVQFLQMLGRVRRYPNSHLNVYISNADDELIAKWRQSCYTSVKAAELFEINPAKFYDDYIQTSSPRVNVRGSFTILGNGRAHFNLFQKRKKEIYDLPFWESIKNRCLAGEENAFLREKFSWIGKEFNLENFAGRRQFEEALNELNEYLEEVEGKEMRGEDKKSFSQRFSELYKKAFGKRKEDKSSVQVYKAAVIKKLLAENSLQYMLQTKEGGWILNRKMEVEENSQGDEPDISKKL